MPLNLGRKDRQKSENKFANFFVNRLLKRLLRRKPETKSGSPAFRHPFVSPRNRDMHYRF
ncbi:hypothetical protein RMSM_02314 [Rhodopirellula maiorica SM1]|uniref:Uncharacterized protein n=1 Tax=Rhodopirellula maiorica SM1 TaxID=1265738 RepID=M5S3K4_9BACT|nr:hypothetical protein RMSM_02314 [Rhodopirellula maiorica SM1]